MIKNIQFIRDIKFLLGLGGMGIAFVFLLGCTPQSNEQVINVSEKLPENVQEKTPEPEDWGIAELTSPIFKSITSKGRACPLESEGIKYIDPIPKIVELAKKHRLVMLNEWHSKPLHRVFNLKVAEALALSGYSYYGPEWLNGKSNIKRLMERGYPLNDELFYIEREPILGQTLEGIIASGYALFAFETSIPTPRNAVSRIAHRDGHNAENIIELMSKPSKGKFIVHTGPHHIKETLDSSGETWLAKFIKEKSDIDPLTIAQTDCYGSGYFKGGTLGYAMPADKDGNPVSFGGYDVIVIPPIEEVYHERPLWLKSALGRVFVDVPDALKFDDQYTDITAVHLDRHEYAGAEDTIYRKPFSDKVLALRPGRYRIEATNKDKELLASIDYVVDGQ